MSLKYVVNCFTTLYVQGKEHTFDCMSALSLIPSAFGLLQLIFCGDIHSPQLWRCHVYKTQDSRVKDIADLHRIRFAQYKGDRACKVVWEDFEEKRYIRRQIAGKCSDTGTCNPDHVCSLQERGLNEWGIPKKLLNVKGFLLPKKAIFCYPKNTIFWPISNGCSLNAKAESNSLSLHVVQ